MTPPRVRRPGSNTKSVHNRDKVPPRWRPRERKVRGTAVIEVNELPLRVPKFSFKASTARVDDNGQVIETIPFLSQHNVEDGIILLQELADKYAKIRAEKQREYDERADAFDDPDNDYEDDSRVDP